MADASCDAEAISICHAKGPFLRALSSAIGRRRLTGSGFAGPFTRIVTTLENGSRWRMEVAGEWQAGWRWRLPFSSA
jgi:hypothetical protein